MVARYHYRLNSCSYAICDCRLAFGAGRIGHCRKTYEDIVILSVCRFVFRELIGECKHTHSLSGKMLVCKCDFIFIIVCYASDRAVIADGNQT